MLEGLLTILEAFVLELRVFNSSESQLNVR